MAKPKTSKPKAAKPLPPPSSRARRRTASEVAEEDDEFLVRIKKAFFGEGCWFTVSDAAQLTGCRDRRKMMITLDRCVRRRRLERRSCDSEPSEWFEYRVPEPRP